MAKSAGAVIAAIIVVLCSCISGQHYPPSSSYNDQEIQALVGQECSPPFGYLRHVCGPEIQLEEIVIPAPDYLHGPNTCRVTRISQRNELDYTFQKLCDYILSGYYYVRHCQAVCQPTYTCSDRNQTLERSNFECCPGFQVRPAEDRSHYDYMFRLYYSPIPVLPVGCPRAAGEDILECLSILELTEFINFVNSSDIFPMFLNSSDSDEFTIFAPTNAAFEAMRRELEASGVSLDTLVGHYIVPDSTLKESDLGFNLVFMTLSDTNLHTAVVVYGDRTLLYNPRYTNNNHYSNLVRHTKVPFIGGARIENADACLAEGVTLHVIDRVLVPGMETIATIIERNFTMFAQALRFTRVLDFLDKEDVSRTVFVPTDEAFSAQIPDDLFACLLTYMRLPLSDLVLYHIAEGAEYTPSLSLRGFSYTLLRSQILKLTTSPEGVITFTTDPPANITVANIPAINGVIHVIDNVLIAPNMDFGMCSDFVPTTPPPVTMPAPVTTDAPETTPPDVTPDPDVTTDAPETTPPDVTPDPDVTTDSAATGLATPGGTATLAANVQRIRNP